MLLFSPFLCVSVQSPSVMSLLFKIAAFIHETSSCCQRSRGLILLVDCCLNDVIVSLCSRSFSSVPVRLVVRLSVKSRLSQTTTASGPSPFTSFCTFEICHRSTLTITITTMTNHFMLSSSHRFTSSPPPHHHDDDQHLTNHFMLCLPCANHDRPKIHF
jgi:hypothetical protein